MILLPLMFVMFVLGCIALVSTKFILKGWVYRVFFFLLGAMIPIIDVPYVKYLHSSYCEGDIGLQVYKEVEPQNHFYVENSRRISIYDFFSEKIEFIEYYDSRINELWKVKKVDGELIKESITEANSLYEYVDQHKNYRIDYGIKRIFTN